jgi:histidine phosphotransferase ChpT
VLTNSLPYLEQNEKKREGVFVSDLEFSSLLCSRLCHDLVSPVGALINGIELLADEQDPAMQAQCMELLANSARQTANRLKFFRLAFGAAGGYADQVDTREAQAAVEGLFSPDKVTVSWQVAAPAMSKPAVKILLNLCLLAGEALLRGGTLTVAAETTAEAIQLVVQANGSKTLLAEDLRSALLGNTPQAQLMPRAAPSFLVATLVANAGGSLQLSPPNPESLTIGVSLPRA